MPYENWGTGKRTNEDTSTTKKKTSTKTWTFLLPQEVRKTRYTCLTSITYESHSDIVYSIFLRRRWKGGISNKVHFTRTWSRTTSSRNFWTPSPLNGEKLAWLKQGSKITLTHSTGNVLVHLPRQVVSRRGSEERVACPNHKGVLVAARMKQRRQQLQHPT